MDARTLYLDLLKKSLINSLHGAIEDVDLPPTERPWCYLAPLLRRRGIRMVRRRHIPDSMWQEGRGWPSIAQTMVGLKRLDNVQFCVEDVLRNGIPGDLVETGVWRGGTAILMRAILKVNDVADRRVWAADSFEGLPPPDLARYPQDSDSRMHEEDCLAVSLEEVQANFTAYGLLDPQVVFLKGWFKETLPSAPVEQIAVLRLDGDLYQSTMDAFDNLYPRLSIGGYCIVDDFGCDHRCRQAVLDYRERNGIVETIETVDWTAVYWRKGTPT